MSGSTDKYLIHLHEGTTGVTINLNSVSYDLGGQEKGCIELDGNSSATINVNGNCYLHGGRDSGAGPDNGHAAIYVNTNAVLYLNVNGTLNAYGGSGGEDRGAAAIGDGDEQNSGTMYITVNDGGVLYAEGADGAAGIGGGE